MEWNSYVEGGVEAYTKRLINQWGDRTPEEAAFTACQTLGLLPSLKNEIISVLKDRGYNAMVDEASVGGQNGWAKEGIDPLIIFDSSVLTTINKQNVTINDEIESNRRYNEWASVYRNSNVAWSDEKGFSL